ncbi:MAG: 2Fe-2S iron-sulfur cluster-binding protein [Planctomycetota bacterium]
MSAQDAIIEVDGRRIECPPGATVLSALEQAGLDVPSGCRAGTCKKCMVQADGPAPAAAQRGLRAQLADQGFFLACQACPADPPAQATVRLRDPRGPAPVSAHVNGIDAVAPDVARIFLTVEAELPYRPGQYVDVLHPSGATRSYSLASLPEDGRLEMHVRRVPNGQVSGWLHGLDPGDELRLRGPFGLCYYVDDAPAQRLLLIGAGTGLAPLVGIARSALACGHTGPIDLVHGGLTPERLYLRDELGALAEQHPSLRVHHCVLRDATEREHQGALDEVALRVAGPLAETRAYLCGDDAIVRTLQRGLFLAGLPSGEIHADPFEPARPAGAPG